MKILSVSLVLIVLLTSCGQKLEESILGTWEVTEFVSELEFEFQNRKSSFDRLSRGMSGTKFKFKPDGFFIEVSRDQTNKLDRYEVDSDLNSIIMNTNSTSPMSMKVSKITDSSMKWFIDLEDFGGVRILLKRVADVEEDLFR